MSDAAFDGCLYLVPLRWDDDHGLDELTAYLSGVSQLMPVMVVDGSPEANVRCHRAAWEGVVTHHLRAPGRTRNGKADGVLAGLAATPAAIVVIADDDVRWEAARLTEAVALLEGADLVRPQNVFDPVPWHAHWDTARSLINRAVHSDFPGTLVLRRAALPLDPLGAPRYDGDVLFENLELIRTVLANGGREVRADALFVGRRPPTLQRFAEQRVRQAYDSAAQPARLLVELALLPTIIFTRPRGTALLTLAIASVALAEAGRRRAGGRRVYPSTAALWAPLWMLERALCAWLALGHRARGGMPYRGRRMLVAAHPMTELQGHHGRA